MALVRSKGEPPKDAIRLTEDEALQYQWKLIWNWEEQSKVLPLRYGAAVSGFCCGLAGFYLNNHYRQKLKLRTFGKLSSFLPNVILPTIAGSFFHMQFVTSDILLHKTQCPVCLEVRAIAGQTFLGLLYPVILSPVAGFVNANNYLTYNVPPFRNPKEVVKLFWKFTKPITTSISIILALQTLSASLLTYLELNVLHDVETELLKAESTNKS